MGTGEEWFADSALYVSEFVGRSSSKIFYGRLRFLVNITGSTELKCTFIRWSLTVCGNLDGYVSRRPRNNLNAPRSTLQYIPG